MAPIAVVSSPGMTTTCTPVVSRRARTAATSSGVAPGVITIIIGALLEPEVPDAQLVRPEVVGELVADGDGHLLAQQVGVVAEVAAQGVAEDDDLVGHVVAGHA